MTTSTRIRQLRQLLARLEAEERGDRPLSLEQIRRMSPEEIEVEWARIRQALGGKDAGREEQVGPAAGNRAMNNALRRAAGRPVEEPGEQTNDDEKKGVTG